METIVIYFPTTNQYWSFVQLNTPALAVLFDGLFVSANILSYLIYMHDLPQFSVDDDGLFECDLHPERLNLPIENHLRFDNLGDFTSLLSEVFRSYYRRLFFILDPIEEVDESTLSPILKPLPVSTALPEFEPLKAGDVVSSLSTPRTDEASSDLVPSETEEKPSFFEYLIGCVADWGLCCCRPRP